MAESLRELRHGAEGWTRYPLLVLGLLVAATAVCHWVKLRRGIVLLRIARSIDLKGGEVFFPEPPHPFELWIFCDVPFSRYHGRIEIAFPASESETVISLRPRSIWSGRIRSDFSPIVWRAKNKGAEAGGGCRLRFELESSFPSRTEKFQFITLLVKAA